MLMAHRENATLHRTLHRIRTQPLAHDLMLPTRLEHILRGWHDHLTAVPTPLAHRCPRK